MVGIRTDGAEPGGAGGSRMATVIETHELVKTYGELNAVDHLSLGVREGTIFSLLGPNGAGKTTTVEILEGLRAPSGGSARVLEHDVRTEYAKIRRRVGILPQDFEPFDRLTPREAVAYWARKDCAARSVGLPCCRCSPASGSSARAGGRPYSVCNNT